MCKLTKGKVRQELGRRLAGTNHQLPPPLLLNILQKWNWGTKFPKTRRSSLHFLEYLISACTLTQETIYKQLALVVNLSLRNRQVVQTMAICLESFAVGRNFCTRDSSTSRSAAATLRWVFFFFANC